MSGDVLAVSGVWEGVKLPDILVGVGGAEVPSVFVSTKPLLHFDVETGKERVTLNERGDIIAGKEKYGVMRINHNELLKVLTDTGFEYGIPSDLHVKQKLASLHIAGLATSISLLGFGIYQKDIIVLIASGGLLATTITAMYEINKKAA